MAVEGRGSIQYGGSTKAAGARIALDEGRPGTATLVVAGHNFYDNGGHQKQGVRFALELDLDGDSFIGLAELALRGASACLAASEDRAVRLERELAGLRSENANLRSALGKASVTALLQPGPAEPQPQRPRGGDVAHRRFLVLTADGVVRMRSRPPASNDQIEGAPVAGWIEVGKDLEEVLVASSVGHGFRCHVADLPDAPNAPPRALLVLRPYERAVVLHPIRKGDDFVAVVGENRKLLVFPLDELPVYLKARGARLQSYKDAGLADAITFRGVNGLAWTDSSGSTRKVDDLGDWKGARGKSGRMAPRGFPRDNRFALDEDWAT